MDDEPSGHDPYLGQLNLAGIPQVSTLTTQSETACARGRVSAVDGQGLYVSDVSDDEVGTALASRKRRSGHIRARPSLIKLW